MYSGRSSSTSPPRSILAESASLVPEDHNPTCCSAGRAFAENHLIVTVTVVAFQLEGYDLLPKLVPKGLEFLSMVHVLCVHAGGPDITGTEENHLP